MSEIEAKTKLKIFGVGFLFSLLGVLMIWAFYARLINDIAVDLLDGNNILLLVIIGNFGITCIVSVVSGIIITEDIAKRSVYQASGVAIFVSFVILIGLCYFGLVITYPEVFSELQGIDVIFAFPSVIMYFSIYALGNSFIINIIAIIIYYILFLTFLDTFYEYEIKYKHYDSVFEEFESRRL